MTRPTVATKPTPTAKPPAPPAAKPEGWRDTVEQFAVAFLLALLIRGFEAEAFVIPTGSMAPTLRGRHKDLTCDQCGYAFAVNASEEAEGPAPAGFRSGRVDSGICVNCRNQVRGIAATPSFKGDRILVLKFPYEFPDMPGSTGPSRWDVVVFRYPEEPEVNYIKRLVGLPGEDLRIHYGDLLTRPTGGPSFFRPHKPLIHQQAMMIDVSNDALRPKALADSPEWARWAGEGWREEGVGNYVPAAASDEWSSLKYRHRVPDPEQWAAALEGRSQPRPPRSSLITDFYSYNTNLSADASDPSAFIRGEQKGAWFQPHWVGDLAIESQLDVEAPKGRIRYELVESGETFRFEVDLATGLGSLFRGDQMIFAHRVATGLERPGKHNVAFANVDNRVTVWVDGRTPFEEGPTYEDYPGVPRGPKAGDLEPVTISVRDGAAVRVSGLVLKRDIYYTQVPGGTDYDGLSAAFDGQSPVTLLDSLSDPARFAPLGTLQPKDYTIGADRYMMMGDNSPRSKDGRGWSTDDRLDEDHPHGWDGSGRNSWEVPRSLLVGKAFFIYWPHAIPFWPKIRLGPDVQVPFRPAFERMRWIR